MNDPNHTDSSTTRRDFLKSAGVAGAALAANATLLSNVHAGGNDTIRVGLIGCGGRGTGAAEQCLRAGPNVHLVAMGDAFQDRLDSCHQRLSRNQDIAARVDVAAERRFVGLTAFERVINACDLVILATPPGFRPQHIRAVVRARKHLFTEKPVAVDGPGVRTCLEAYDEAIRQRLSIVAGTQRRCQTGYLQSMERIHNGELGTIVTARCYWNQGSLWHRARTASMSDLEWQVRNWLYFTWLSGDHICEQHVHNIDVINWALRAHPQQASGMGGRQVRTGPEFGHIFDHFAVEYTYPNDVHVYSFCRQIQGCENNVSESVAGTRGTWFSPGPSSPSRYQIRGERAWTFASRDDNQPYQEEHNKLIASIRNNQPINDLQNVAHSTLTAIMGRMATYTGRPVTWEQALNSQESLMPQNLAWDMNLGLPPSWDMNLPMPPVAMPGRRT